MDREPPPPREQPLVIRALRGVWLWPALFMAAIGLWRIRLPEMWQDELVTISVVSRSTRQILSLLQHVDAVHGAYYLLVHGWVRAFGESPLAIRIPSVLAMAGAAACVALIGQRLFGWTAGIAGGFVFAVVPAVTRFAQEARSYALVVLFVSLATLLLLLAIQRSTVGTWVGYGACVTAIACLNPVALSVVIGHLVGILVWAERRGLWRTVGKFGLAALVGVLPASPVVYLGTQQASRQINWINLEPHAVWVVWPRSFASDWLAWAVTALVVVALVRYRRRAAFPAAVALVPVLVIWLVSLGKLNYFFSKYLLFVIPLWAVLAGAGLTAVRWKTPILRTAVPAVGLVILAVLAIPGQKAMRGSLSHSYYTYPDPRVAEPYAYREAAHIIAKNYQPGDAIGFPQLPKIWWFMHDKGVSYYLPKNVQPRVIFIERSAAQNDDLYATECPVPERCFDNERRVWIVLPYQTANAVGQFTDEQRKLLVPGYVQVYAEFPPGLTVALMQRE
jgi:mannosyltransferase